VQRANKARRERDQEKQDLAHLLGLGAPVSRLRGPGAAGGACAAMCPGTGKNTARSGGLDGLGDQAGAGAARGDAHRATHAEAGMIPLQHIVG